jgi:HK97 family phage prohead protease
MEIREYSFEVRLQEETRTVTGVAVPYGQTIEVNGYHERVQRGAFDTSIQVPLLFGHDHRSIPIGKVIILRDTETGLEIEAKLNNTTQAEDVYRALQSGDLNSFSIGFIPINSRNDDDVVVREKVDLKEVSVVTFPAYSQANVVSVREAESTEKENNKKQIMENTNDYSAEIGEVRDTVADLSRKIELMGEQNDNGSVAQYRSAGEWLKALSTNEQGARDLATRDFGTMADADVTRPAWVNAQLKLVEKQRVVKNLFDSAPLPASGNTIEYPRVKSQTGTVGKQSAEGAALPYLEVALESATANVETYGGYSSLSRQSIERSDVAYLETVLRFQTIAYANATEKAVQDALVGASGVNTIELGGATGSAKTGVQYLEAVIDAKAAIDTNSTLGLSADFILISADVHKKLALTVDTAGRPLFETNGDGMNTFGSLPLNGKLLGTIDGTPVVVGKNLAAGTIVVASASALISYESAGAPFRLQDENIINLTKDFSLYGYMAIAIPDPKGITKIVDAA